MLPLSPRPLVALGGALILLLRVAPASAEVFHYTDRSGRLHPVEVHPLRIAPSAAPPAAAPLAAAPLAAAPEPPAVVAPPSPEPPAEAPRTPEPPRTAEAPALPLFARAPSPELTLPVVPLSPEEPPSRAPFFPVAQEAAAHYALPVELVLAVIKVESNFNPMATSRRGARGLMQIMPTTAAELGVTDILDPRQNIFAGARYLRILVNEFDGQVSLAVAAYNAGAGAVRRAGGIPPIPETQGYVPAVLAAYRGYRAASERPRRDTPW